MVTQEAVKGIQQKPWTYCMRLQIVKNHSMLKKEPLTYSNQPSMSFNGKYALTRMAFLYCASSTVTKMSQATPDAFLESSGGKGINPNCIAVCVLAGNVPSLPVQMMGVCMQDIATKSSMWDILPIYLQCNRRNGS